MKIHCKKTLFSLFLLVFTLSTAAAEDAEEAGFVPMFNGKDLTGWKASEHQESWSIQEGMLVCFGERSHLFYTGPGSLMKDFHFKCEVKATPGSNSGIYFHTKFQESGWPKYGYECQVNITHKDPKKTGSLYGVENVENPPAKDDQWYTQEIIVTGRRIVLKTNGKVTVDHTEAEGKPPFDSQFERRLGEGTIALQAHDPESRVYFRNLRFKAL